MRSASVEDPTARARIRDAAIECFAAEGIAATSIRTIAASANVSPALVMYHFGSKDQLRVACDEYVAMRIREQKGGAMAQGVNFDPLAALRSGVGSPPFVRYLARTLAGGSQHVADLVDELVDDAAEYIATGVEAGLLTPSNMPKQRAAILTLWSLGGVVLHEHMERLLGVDITADFAQDPQQAASYVAPVMDILGGFITETTKQLMTEAFAPASEETKEPL